MPNAPGFLAKIARRSRCLLIGLIICGSLPQAGPAQDTSRAFVQGRILDEQGAGMPFVNVQIVGPMTGGATDEGGRFRFATAHLGRQVLRASMIGFGATESVLHLAAGDTAMVVLTLREQLLSLGEAVVTASTYTTGQDDRVTLTPLEIITTPGASLDIFLAIKSFPGVATADEGAGLFVRGGDVDETVVLLDGATVSHPYKYESPAGGVFGTIPPFLISGTQFSSGGFSALYGNALSGVLAMDSENLPDGSSYTLNIGLGAASLAGHMPLVPGKLGVRFSGNRSFTGLLFRLNGIAHRFPESPVSEDANLSLVYRYSTTGQLKLFNFINQDRLGVEVREPSFTDVYRSGTQSGLHSLQWRDILGDWMLKVSLSYSRYAHRQRLGNLDYSPSDQGYKLRVDAERALSAWARLQAGGEAERLANGFSGQVPLLPGILDPAAPTRRLDERYAARRTGAYANAEFQPARRLLAAVGVRVDHHAPSGEIVIDPRLSARLQLSKEIDLRAAWGIYHQFPSPFLYNGASGNPDLKAQQAQHFIAGLQVERDGVTIRAEGYFKPYRRLALRHETLYYTNDGDGAARGLDFFAKYGGYLETRVSGWISYSWMQSTRLQVRRVGEHLAYDRGPAPFDITHNVTLVGKVRLSGRLSTAFTLRHATGRPVTPIVGAQAVEGASYYLPIEGPAGSERLPAHQRLDVQLIYRIPVHQHTATFYLALQNLLGRANVSRYEYSADYLQREERTTNYIRFVYVGAMFNLNP